MSTFFNNLQPELISSITVMIILSIIFIKVGKKAEAADPLERPKGALLVAEVGIKTIYDYLKGLLSLFCDVICLSDCF